MSHFKEGEFVHIKNSSFYIEKAIGSGVQGEVYKAFDCKNRKHVALKFLFGNYAPRKMKKTYYDRTNFLSCQNSFHKAFAWPEDVGEFDEANGCFLYTMPLKEGFMPTGYLIRFPKSFTPQIRVQVILKVLEAFISLEKNNLFYADISEENILFKVNSVGEVEVAIIDCENITPPSMTLGLQGCGLYKAPEVFLGKSPTIESMAHSMCVWIFRILSGGTHPFNGKKTENTLWDEETIVKFYGINPEFVFSSENDNEPYPTAIEAWEKLPLLMHYFFIYAFSPDVLKGKKPRMSLQYMYEHIKKAYNL